MCLRVTHINLPMTFNFCQIVGYADILVSHSGYSLSSFQFHFLAYLALRTALALKDFFVMTLFGHHPDPPTFLGLLTPLFAQPGNNYPLSSPSTHRISTLRYCLISFLVNKTALVSASGFSLFWTFSPFSLVILWVLSCSPTSLGPSS